MKTAEQVNSGKLKEAIKALNESGLLANRLKVIGKTEELLNSFVGAIDNLPEEKVPNIPKDVVLFYNDLFSDEAAGAAAPAAAAPAPAAEAAASATTTEAAAAPAAEAAAEAGKKPKKEKKAKEPKPEGEKRKSNLPVKPKTQYGHVIGSQAGILDECLMKGATIDQMKAEAKCDQPRITSHIKHLKNDKKLNVTEENGVWKIR